jgi:hypothetical protein
MHRWHVYCDSCLLWAPKHTPWTVDVRLRLFMATPYFATTCVIESLLFNLTRPPLFKNVTYFIKLGK